MIQTARPSSINTRPWGGRLLRISRRPIRWHCSADSTPAARNGWRTYAEIGIANTLGQSSKQCDESNDIRRSNLFVIPGNTPPVVFQTSRPGDGVVAAFNVHHPGQSALGCGGSLSLQTDYLNHRSSHWPNADTPRDCSSRLLDDVGGTTSLSQRRPSVKTPSISLDQISGGC